MLLAWMLGTVAISMDATVGYSRTRPVGAAPAPSDFVVETMRLVVAILQLDEAMFEAPTMRQMLKDLNIPDVGPPSPILDGTAYQLAKETLARVEADAQTHSLPPHTFRELAHQLDNAASIARQASSRVMLGR
jgi:hypothetical protein